MNIAIIGYGKMGKLIEEIAIQRGHNISYTIGRQNNSLIQDINSLNTDVAIEFSIPQSGYINCKQLVSNNVTTISGTTGWKNQLGEIETLALQSNTGFLYASNFSLGVNLFFKLSSLLAKMMSHFDNYEVFLEEIHHIHKLDAPSGTALTLLEGILKNYPDKKDFTLSDKEYNQNKKELVFINALREGEVPGTHKVQYESDLDTLEITHIAKDRKSFALGAVLVAEWMNGKKGVLTMNDFLNI